MKRENAVAPVIAAMLVLAVIVTFFAVWNATAIPAMKEQAEVSHLQEVESGILRFSSDIDYASSSPSSMALSERIPLGGGDILFSSTKSGGMLAIHGDDPSMTYMRIKIYNATSSSPVGNDTLQSSNFSYQPAGNFWQDQGYVWSQGYVNVTKGTLDPTPLEFSTMDAVDYKLTGALFGASGDPDPGDPARCSVLFLKGVNISAADAADSVSGNGVGTLSLVSSQESEIFLNVTRVNVTTNRSPAGPLTGFPKSLHDSVNTSFNENVVTPHCSNIRFDPAYSTNSTISLSIDPVPNVTVIRQITDISLSAH
jgi:hypothetical protein